MFLICLTPHACQDRGISSVSPAVHHDTFLAAIRLNYLLKVKSSVLLLKQSEAPVNTSGWF